MPGVGRAESPKTPVAARAGIEAGIGTPPAAIEKLNKALIEAANDPDTVGSAATYDLIANRDQDGAR